MNPVIKYFNGERDESFLFLALGFLGLVIGSYLIFIKASSYWKGMAIPFILVSVLEIIVGISLIYRSPKDIIRVENYIKNNQVKIKTGEIPRMEKVMSNFVIFRYAEIALIILGMALMYSSMNDTFWRGIGLGLFIQASIVLCLDFFAERRGHHYMEYLKEFSEKL